MIEELKERFKWWRARTFGERPMCETDGCDSSATVYLSSDGYQCMMCYASGQPYKGVGFVRDLSPEDFYRDD